VESIFLSVFIRVHPWPFMLGDYIMNLRLKRTPGIYLVGFMGSGKSTIGRALARHMGWSFFDSDDEIESAEQMPISEIFDTRGEAEFRRIESAIVRQHVSWIERGRPAVLALGGGAFVAEANRQLLLSNGVAVWLDCPWETVERRVGQASHRPLARDPERLRQLYDERRSVYALADVHVPIESDDPAVAVESILRHPILR
jgi:shikimate kinase